MTPSDSVAERVRAPREQDETRQQRGTLVAHPHDPGFFLGDLPALTRLPAEVSAVVLNRPRFSAAIMRVAALG